MLQHPRTNKRLPCQEGGTLSTSPQTFKIWVQASSSRKSRIFGRSDRKTLMNDGRNAGSLYKAAERHLPKHVSCFVYPLYFHIFMASTFELNVLRVWCLRQFSCVCSAHVLAHCLPFGRVPKSARMELAGTCDEWFNLTDPAPLGCVAVISEWGVVGIPSIWGPLQLQLFTWRLRVEVEGCSWPMQARLGWNVCAMWCRAARACGGCEGWLGAWRRWKLPDKENMLAATSPAWSQLCVSHWILEPRGGITGRIHNSAVKTPQLFLSRLSENQAWAQVALRRFICTPSLANGRWNWETPRNLSFPHQCLFFFGLVWRLLDRISGPARIIILESIFVGASTGTEQIHPVFSCYLFIVEYAEAALLFFWRQLRRCQFSASHSHPLPPFSISNVLFLPSLCYLTIRVSFFQLKPIPTDSPSVPPFLSALLSPCPSLISSVLSLISIKREFSFFYCAARLNFMAD